MPLGSCSEWTKHENASLNSGPHGPWAIPPRHGQSQLISPVTGLKAPPPEDSSSLCVSTSASGGLLSVSSPGTGVGMSEGISSVCIGGGGGSAAGTDGAGAEEVGRFLGAANVSEQCSWLISMSAYQAQVEQHQVLSADCLNSATMSCMQQTRQKLPAQV